MVCCAAAIFKETTHIVRSSVNASCAVQVVHRDVKPENIILEGGKPGGKVFLVDFGGVLQGTDDADSEVMETGTVVGTYGYMAPEQLRGSARPASDLFALGGTLLHLLTGIAAPLAGHACPTAQSGH